MSNKYGYFFNLFQIKTFASIVAKKKKCYQFITKKYCALFVKMTTLQLMPFIQDLQGQVL